MELSDADFLKVIDATPLVAIDLVLTDCDGGILMGMRTNQPAIGSWFVPGGRIKKGEDIASALRRIAKIETGVELTRASGRLLGVFDHQYDTNFAKVEGVCTQYVVIAFEFRMTDLDCQTLPLEQHSDWKWVCESDTEKVHKNAAAYFPAIKTRR